MLADAKVCAALAVMYAVFVATMLALLYGGHLEIGGGFTFALVVACRLFLWPFQGNGQRVSTRIVKEAIAPLCGMLITVLAALLAPGRESSAGALIGGGLGVLFLTFLWLVEARARTLLEAMTSENWSDEQRVTAYKWISDWTPHLPKTEAEIWAGHVSALEGAGRYQDAVKRFLRGAGPHRHSPQAGKALMSAARAASVTGEEKDGQQLLQQIADRYPNTWLAHVAASKLETTSENAKADQQR